VEVKAGSEGVQARRRRSTDVLYLVLRRAPRGLLPAVRKERQKDATQTR
jgi:hypothetical protein